MNSFKNLPSGWRVVRLGDVFNFLKTYQKPRSDLSDFDEISYIHYGEIHTKYKYNLDFSKSTLPKIAKDKFKDKIEFVKNGDLIVVDTSEDYADIAKSVEVKNLNSKAVSGLHTFLLRDKDNNFANGFKGCILYSPLVCKVIKKLATGISVLSISKTNLQNLEILLPPIDEQEKIAEILYTWDKAINLTADLIKSKKEFKKGLMQNLLTAKIRLPNFNDEWQETKLGNILKEISKRNLNCENNLVLSVTNKFGFVAQTDFFDKSVASKDTANYKIIQKGNFAYNPSRINVGSLALLKEFENGILSPMYVVFEVLKQTSTDFINHWFCSHNFTGVLSDYLAGSVRESLAFKDMKKIKIKLPNLEEQQKIAEILTACDDEIKILENKLENLKTQKQGLMQQLLTGKVRVI